MADKNRTTPNQAQQQNDRAQGSAQQGSGQQGMNDPRDRQSQQFDSTSGQSGGSYGSDTRFVDQIRERMAVVGPDGEALGTVDSVDGQRIKLTRDDSADGRHHFVECAAITGIEGGKVRLAETPDWSRQR